MMPLLVTFIPMLTDTGGNAGSQSSTLVIRGMAVGDIALSDFPKVLWKELRVSLLVGAVLSLVNLVRLLLLLPGKRAGVRHSHPVPVRYGGPGQDHRRSSAHAGQAGAGPTPPSWPPL